MKSLCQCMVILACLFTAACTAQTKHAAADTPKNWWSDNYLAMWQDGSDETFAPSHAKPMALPK